MTALTGTVYLSRAVLSEVVEDPSVTPRYVVSGTAGGIGSSGGYRTDSIQQDGQFRNYGNGNTRLILGSAQTRTQTFALKALTPSQVQTVIDLIGHTVCYRDIYGRRVFGAYTNVALTEIPFSGKPEDGTLLTDVAIVIQSVTHDEAV